MPPLLKPNAGRRNCGIVAVLHPYLGLLLWSLVSGLSFTLRNSPDLIC